MLLPGDGSFSHGRNHDNGASPSSSTVTLRPAPQVESSAWAHSDNTELSACGPASSTTSTHTPVTASQIISPRHKNSLPLVDALCDDCKVFVVNYSEPLTLENNSSIRAELLLVERGCLVRRPRGETAEQLLLHSYLSEPGSPLSLAEAAKRQAETLIQIWREQEAARRFSTTSPPKNVVEDVDAARAGAKSRQPTKDKLGELFPSLPIVPPPQKNHLYSGVDLGFRLDSWGEEGRAPRDPVLTIGSGVWDLREMLSEKQLAGAGTPFAALVVEVFRKSPPNRPTIVVSAHLFGQFYHTLAELLVPLFTTLKFLGWREADVWLWHAVGIGNRESGPWRYWEKVVPGYRKLAAEIGLHLSMAEVGWKFGSGGFPQFENDVEMWPRRTRHRRGLSSTSVHRTEQSWRRAGVSSGATTGNEQDDSAGRGAVVGDSAGAETTVWRVDPSSSSLSEENDEEDPSSPGGLDGKKILGPAIPWQAGRFCPSESAPLVFGALQEARQCGQTCFGADEFRPAIAPTWQLMNDILWENSVEAARNFVDSGESPVSGVDELHAHQQRLFVPLLNQFADKLGRDAIPRSEEQIVAHQDPHLQHGIFIVRRQGKRLHENQEELERVYEEQFAHSFRTELKFQIHFLDFEKLAFPDEQRALISQTQALIGVAGAGLIQQWWLPPNARLVQIGCAKCDFKLGMHENRKPIMFFSRAATQLQQPILHYVQVSGEYSVGRGGKSFLTPKFFRPAHFWEQVRKFLQQTSPADGREGASCAGVKVGSAEGVSGDEGEVSAKFLRPQASAFCLVTDDGERDDGDLHCFPPVGWPGAKNGGREVAEWMEAGSSVEEKNAVREFWDSLKNER